MKNSLDIDKWFFGLKTEIILYKIIYYNAGPNRVPTMRISLTSVTINA